ncbi:MAG: hypothetical protein Q9168_007593 [Polycauliona sp. 1 TL-2023]
MDPGIHYLIALASLDSLRSVMGDLLAMRRGHEELLSKLRKQGHDANSSEEYRGLVMDIEGVRVQEGYARVTIGEFECDVEVLKGCVESGKDRSQQKEWSSQVGKAVVEDRGQWRPNDAEVGAVKQTRIQNIAQGWKGST